MLFQRFVLREFGLGGFFKCIGSIVKGTGHVNYQDTVVFFNNDVGSQWQSRLTDGAVGGNLAKTYSIRDSCCDLIVAFTDLDKFGATVVQDVR